MISLPLRIYFFLISRFPTSQSLTFQSLVSRSQIFTSRTSHRSCRRRGLICITFQLALLLLSTTLTRATYRADFFDETRRPTVTFDKSRLTWSLRNQAVERLIRYDKEAGRLETVQLKDLHTRHAIFPVPGSEGILTFASPIVETPTRLSRWKQTTTLPTPNWTKPEFDDQNWSQTDAAQRAPKPERQRQTEIEKTPDPVWFRFPIDQKLVKSGKAYALHLPNGLPTGDEFRCEVYCDGTLLQAYPTDVSALGHPEVIDLPAAPHLIAIKAPSTWPAVAYFTEVGTSPLTLDLKSDWTYSHHAINVADNNSLLLTIHLSGSKRKEGFEIDVCYQIYPGEEPTIVKWLTFTSHRKSRFIIDGVLLDRWAIPDTWQRPANPTLSPTIHIQENPASGDLLLVAHFGRPLRTMYEREGKSVVTTVDLGITVQPDTPMQTAHAITAFTHGSFNRALFLYQLYFGQYISAETPFSVPLAYNTRLAYGNGIDASISAQIIPRIARMGLQAFVLDDGWQTNSRPNSGRYGDWQADRTRFPMGILPVSTLARLNHLRFGLWIDLNRVDADSQSAELHPDWLYSPFPPYHPMEDGTPIEQMCFTGVWARQSAQSLLELFRGTSVSYLKYRGRISDGCSKNDHEHPVGRSGYAEDEAWMMFRERVSKADAAFAFVTDPFSPGFWEPLLADPARKQIARWLENPELLLAPHGMQGANLPSHHLLFPPFGISGEALCHLPTQDRPSEEVANYLWSYIAATGCAFEVQGNIETMDQTEEQTARRWIEWTNANRPWLAYTQGIDVSESSQSPARTEKRTISSTTLSSDHSSSVNSSVNSVEINGGQKNGQDRPIRALMHLRNLYKSRYGYICLWNPNSTFKTVNLRFAPSDYFVRLHAGSLSVLDIDSEKPISIHQTNSALEINELILRPFGYTILELKSRQSGSKP